MFLKSSWPQPDSHIATIASLLHRLKKKGIFKPRIGKIYTDKEKIMFSTLIVSPPYIKRGKFMSLLFEKETFLIRNSIFEVYNTLGTGFFWNPFTMKHWKSNFLIIKFHLIHRKNCLLHIRTNH